MQKRKRDSRGKVVYAKDKNGTVISSGTKKGVPLGDVWSIPFLNPKAKERVGHPTQKPIALLRRIMELTTTPGNLVLDPFCGSGTTLVAAKILGRHAIGIDISQAAVNLTHCRLSKPIESPSMLLKKGLGAYQAHSQEASMHLAGVEYTPVQRNKGIDGVLKREIRERPVFLRVQRSFETQTQAAQALLRASEKKGECILVVIVTKAESPSKTSNSHVLFVNSLQLSLDLNSMVKDPTLLDKVRRC